MQKLSHRVVDIARNEQNSELTRAQQEQIMAHLDVLDEIEILHNDGNILNIMTDDNGRIYLIDFGNIRFYEDLFFVQKNFHQYRDKQHRKLYNICTAISRKEDPWKVI